MDKPKKRKRRTLVIIDSESLSPKNHYDLSFLESEKRLDIWFFFKNKIQHSFTLHKDYNAKSVILPRYEEDTLSYIIKRVCYEMGRRGEKYHKLYFIGDAHPLWEGLVQFFRERGYVAHHIWSGDYATASPPPKETTSESLAKGPSIGGPPPLSSPEGVSVAKSPSSQASQSPLSPSQKSKPSSKPKNPLSSELYEKLRAYLMGELAGKKFSRKEFLKVLHKVGISIREDVRPRRYEALVRYLSAEGLISSSPDLKEVVILPHEHAKS